MKDAPKEIWISPTNYRWWTSPCEDLPLLHRYIHAAESKEAADRIEQLEAENAPDVLKGDTEMTELELMANEEARHGNREALERMEAELDFWRKDSAAAWDTCEGYRVKLAQEAYEAQKKAEAERDAAYKRGLEDALEIAVSWHDNGNKPCDRVVAEIEAAIRAQIQEGDK